jgi:hypothetical protein
MTQWIVDNKEALNIQYCSRRRYRQRHAPRQRVERRDERVRRAGRQVPLIAIAGNHDIAGVVHNYSRFDELMERQNFESYPTFGGMEASGRRRFDLVTIGHDDYIISRVGTPYRNRTLPGSTARSRSIPTARRFCLRTGISSSTTIRLKRIRKGLH